MPHSTHLQRIAEGSARRPFSTSASVPVMMLAPAGHVRGGTARTQGWIDVQGGLMHVHDEAAHRARYSQQPQQQPCTRAASSRANRRAKRSHKLQ